jgi:predicted RND superfamily exporter protein
MKHILFPFLILLLLYFTSGYAQRNLKYTSGYEVKFNKENKKVSSYHYLMSILGTVRLRPAIIQKLVLKNLTKK